MILGLTKADSIVNKNEETKRAKYGNLAVWSRGNLTASDASLATTIFVHAIKAMLHLQFIKKIVHRQNGAVDANHSNSRVLYHTNGLARVASNSPSFLTNGEHMKLMSIGIVLQ